MSENEQTKMFYGIVSRVLGVTTAEITDTTSPGTVPSWDSYNALMLISEIEGSFGIKFKMEDVVAVKNIGDIKELLRKYNIAV